MIFFALKQNLFHRILRKRIILRIKSIHLIMEIFENFTEGKSKDYAKMIKIMTSSCRHVVMVTRRVNENFHFFKYLTLWQCGHQVPLSQLLRKRSNRPSRQYVK